MWNERRVKTSYGAMLGIDGELHLDEIESAALENNALGDSARRPVPVYVPLGYDAEGSKRYPVLYVLHGYSGSALRAISGGSWETNVVQRVDRMIREKKMLPVIMVTVDGWTRLGGSQYLNSIHNGNYADYVARDIVAHVDASYRTIANTGGRAILGKSSGGFGAMHLVMEKPGVFGAFAAHSADSYYRQSAVPGFVHAQRVLEKHGSIEAFVSAFESKNKTSQSEFVTMEMIAYSAAYSPRSAKAFDVDLPFDTATGAIRDDVFAQWLAFDPVERVPKKGKELGQLRARYIDCGRRDDYGLDIGARLIAQHIRDLGLSVVHEEFDDDHRNTGYRYETSMPALAGVLDKD